MRLSTRRIKNDLLKYILSQILNIFKLLSKIYILFWINVEKSIWVVFVKRDIIIFNINGICVIMLIFILAQLFLVSILFLYGLQSKHQIKLDIYLFPFQSYSYRCSACDKHVCNFPTQLHNHWLLRFCNDCKQM